MSTRDIIITTILAIVVGVIIGLSTYGFNRIILVAIWGGFVGTVLTNELRK